MNTVEELFGDHRRFLWSICYRMTGNAADADDVVQDTFVRMMEHPPARTDESLRPWLVKVALNLSRDLLRRHKRREYVGPWLPSPVATDDEPSPPSHEPVVEGRTLEDRYDLLESVSFAFLIALERLTPTQRAVLLLCDVFDYSVAETAAALDLTEANVKTTHHRARKAMSAYDGARVIPTESLQKATRHALVQFLKCLERNDVAGVEALLAQDVRTVTDGGGEFRAALRPIIGRDKVMRFYFAINPKRGETFVTFALLNGAPGVIASVPGATGTSAPRYAITVDLNRDRKIAHIYVVFAARKLTAIASAFDQITSRQPA
jgi:RNA polymerase sigma-70 factor (ECF subfamily)